MFAHEIINPSAHAVGRKLVRTGREVAKAVVHVDVHPLHWRDYEEASAVRPTNAPSRGMFASRIREPWLMTSSKSW